MMLLIENIKLAISAIKSNKLRSFLTMLGIIIGISSVIAITSIGDSAKGAVSEEFEAVGSNYLYIMLNWEKVESVYEDDLFSVEEIEALKERFSEDLYYVAPYRNRYATAKNGKVEANMYLYGVAANYEKCVNNINIIEGRMVNQTDIDKNKQNIVLDVRAAKKMFGTQSVVGKTLELEMDGDFREFTIVGVYEKSQTIFDAMEMGEPTYTSYVQYEASAYYPGEPSSYIEIYTHLGKNPTEVAEKICRYVERVKDKEEEYYTYSTAEGQMSQINDILGILSLAIGAIAAISLLVGGIGIMNIMLVSVTERTREIGIRKSLGARTKDILTQFLIEAIILSVIGGIIGMLLGIGIAAIGMMIAGVNLVISPAVVIGAVVFSAVVGLFFGLFPARKAARLDPIEALRYE